MAENPSDLVGKEFIFEYGLDRIIPPSEKTGGVFAIEQKAHRRERIVRCRDCKHSETRGMKRYCTKPMGRAAYFRVCDEDFCSYGMPRNGGGM